MKRIVVVILLIILNFCIINAYTQSPGKERWDVKSLNDKNADKIDTNDLIVSVKALSEIPNLSKVYKNATRMHVEMKTFTIICVVKKVIKEDDGDYHLIVSDTGFSNNQMIVEIINPHYANPKYYSLINQARENLIYYQRKKQLINNTFKITGVAFFDIPHNQGGVAPNYIELHPVLKFSKL